MSDRQRTRLPALNALLAECGLEANRGKELGGIFAHGPDRERVFAYARGTTPTQWHHRIGAWETMTECYEHFEDEKNRENAIKWLKRNLHEVDTSPYEGTAKGPKDGDPLSAKSKSKQKGEKGEGRAERTGIEKHVERIVAEVLQEGVDYEIGEAEESLGALKKALEETKKELEEAKEETARVKAEAKPVIVNIPTPQEIKQVDAGLQHPMFPILLEYVARGHRCLCVGPSGGGKSYGAEQVAKVLDRKMFLMAPVETRFDLLGHSDAAGNYHYTPISEFAKYDGPCILVIDELDRFHARALTALNALLANGKGVFPDLGMVEIDETTHGIISTANTWGMGATAEYCGALKQDAAVLNRHPRRIPWDYDQSFEWELMKACSGDREESAVRFDFVACMKVRENIMKNSMRINWTPRDTMAVAIDRAQGDSLNRALEYSVLASLPEKQKAKALANVNVGEA